MKRLPPEEWRKEGRSLQALSLYISFSSRMMGALTFPAVLCSPVTGMAGCVPSTRVAPEAHMESTDHLLVKFLTK